MNFDLVELNKAGENTLSRTLGIVITEAVPGRVVATMPVGPHNHQPMGLLHGGATVALAETVASIGGWMLVAADGKAVVGQEINANHMRSVRTGIVTAVGTVLHQGHTSQVWEIRITREDGKLLSISRCTLAVIQM
jgi:1,4-dihydroxy-2-naphthoyl-CoA hydrolase